MYVKSFGRKQENIHFELFLLLGLKISEALQRRGGLRLVLYIERQDGPPETAPRVVVLPVSLAK